uniref:Uncharacterized protein n=1 Tax=Neolamprologus brichardi TaxID=32507 RepID=A0A3Q4G5V8_NEOBR
TDEDHCSIHSLLALLWSPPSAGDHEEDEATEKTARETWHRWTSNQRDEKSREETEYQNKDLMMVVKDLQKVQDQSPQRGWIQTQELLAVRSYLTDHHSSS